MMCQRVQAVNNARIKSNLYHELKHLLDEDKADDVANILGILIDGIWVRAGLFAITPDYEKALDEFEFTALHLIGASDEQREVHRAARNKINTIAEIALGSRLFQQKKY